MSGAKRPNTDDLDGQDRLNQSLSMKEGLDPRSVYEDWGDAEVDEPLTPRSDVHCSSPEEIEQYYDELKRDTFKLTQE